VWTSEHDRNAAILKLLQAAHLVDSDPRVDRGLWTEDGPTDLTLEYMEHGAPLSHGETLILQVAMDLWNGGGKARVDELLATLDERNLRAVADAILARDGR